MLMLKVIHCTTYIPSLYTNGKQPPRMNHLPWLFTTPQSAIIPSQLKLPPAIPIQAERAPRLKIPHFPLRRFTPPLPVPHVKAQVEEEGEGEGTQPHILRILELVEQQSQAISKHQGRLDQFIDSTTIRLDQLEESVKAGLQLQVQVPPQALTASRSEEPTESLAKDCEEGLRHFKEMVADLNPSDSDPDATDSTLIDQLEVEPFTDYKNQQARTLLALSRFSSLNEGTSPYVNDGSGDGGGTIDPKVIQSSFQSNDDGTSGQSPALSMMMPGPPDPLSSLRVTPEHSPESESIPHIEVDNQENTLETSVDLRQVSADLPSVEVREVLPAHTTQAPAPATSPPSQFQSTETSPLASTYILSSPPIPKPPSIDTQLSTPPRPPKRPPPTLPQRSYRRRTEPVRLDPSPAQQSETGTSMKRCKPKGLVRKGSIIPGKKKRSLGPKGSLPLGTLGKSDGSRRVKMADWPKVGPNSVIGLGGDIQCEQVSSVFRNAAKWDKS
jgi:hypothetical protein